MQKDLARVRCNEFGEIRVSLQEVHGELYVELRVSGRSAPDGEVSLPDGDVIVVPVHVFSDLCRVLEQAEGRLHKEGLLDVLPVAKVITMEAGEPVTRHIADRPGRWLNTRREPRVSVKLAAEFYLLGAPDTWPSKPLPGQVTGEIRDLSNGGAQVWLPEQFPVGSRLAVFIMIAELIFRGQAEVVAVASHPKGGNYRHNTRWLSLNPQAQAALSQMIENVQSDPVIEQNQDPTPLADPRQGEDEN